MERKRKKIECQNCFTMTRRKNNYCNNCGALLKKDENELQLRRGMENRPEIAQIYRVKGDNHQPMFVVAESAADVKNAAEMNVEKLKIVSISSVYASFMGRDVSYFLGKGPRVMRPNTNINMSAHLQSLARLSEKISEDCVDVRSSSYVENAKGEIFSIQNKGQMFLEGNIPRLIFYFVQEFEKKENEIPQLVTFLVDKGAKVVNGREELPQQD